ncbi:Putative transmembrane efflux protein [Labilithrix luteola]|uniref:Putative transmembrane efflux protein n=1 Tax=Labilithrix luteola TaxID=1391654 RepID=A0A0K1PPP6_9BACT|nr:MFS transporter [Labilithrix luteola]AKU95498.1 Putative transmembrane efflux protein [Labilithrix luteola]
MRSQPSLAPLYGAAFVLAVDTAGVGHLLPGLEMATHAPPRGASWFISIYMLGALLGAPLLARIATRRGRTTVLAASLAMFALASFVVGLSSSYPLTLAARFVQGVAGSPVMPLGAAHLSALAPAGKKGRGLGLLSLSYSGGFLAGMAFVSLFLLVSFRLAYLFTGALASVACIAVARLPVAPTTSSSHDDAERPPPEVSTIAGWFVALALLALAINQVNVDGAGAIAMARFAAVPALALFAWRDRSVRAPLLPRDLFRSRVGLASASLALAAGVGQACVVLLPTCGMAELGVSAAASGPLLIPIVLGGLGTNLLASARLDRWGPKPFLAAGLLGMALGNLVTAWLGTNLLAFEVGALLLGAGVSAMSSGALRYLATLYGAADDADANQAAISLLTNVGVLVGGSLWGAIVPSTSGIGVAAVRVGIVVLTAALMPLSVGVLLVPSRR